MDFKLIQRKTGLVPLHYNMNTDNTRYYKNLVTGDKVDEKNVRELKDSIDMVITKSGEIKDIETLLNAAETFEALSFAVGNAYFDKEGNEHCKAYFAMMK